jgi:hypothetical protein
LDGKDLEFLAFLTLLALLLGLWGAFLLAVHDETGPRFLFIPLEAC